jgi:hypothetical protein
VDYFAYYKSMNKTYKLTFIFLMFLVTSSANGQTNLDTMTDEQLYDVLTSVNSTEAELAGTEFFRRGEKVIPFLLSKKGDKRIFYGGFFTRGSGVEAVMIFMPTKDMKKNKKLLKNGDIRSMEVVALFLINAIFHKSLDFSQTPNLRYETSEGYPKVGNKPQLIKKAWKAVDKWAIQLKAEGLAELQRKKIAPLDLERDGVDFY